MLKGMYAFKFSKTGLGLLVCALIAGLSGWAMVSFLHAKTPPPLVQSAQQQLLSDLIAGNLAAKRGDSGWAARYYLDAARLSQNQSLANRAISMAYQADNRRLLLETSRFNYSLDTKSDQGRYLYAYSLLLNQHTLDSILMYAEVLSDDILHIADYTPLIPEKIAAQSNFKNVLGQVQDKVQSNESALAVMALMYAELNESALAKQENDRALQLEPNNALAIQNQVNFYSQQNNIELAIEFLQQKLNTSPQNNYAQFLLATLYYNAEEIESAKPLFSALLSIDAFKAQSSVYLGEIAAKAGDTTSAKTYFLAAAQDTDLQPFANLLLGDLAVSQQQYDEARTWYEKVDVQPYSFQAQLAIAKTWHLQGDNVAAHRYLQTIDVKDAQQFSLLVRFEASLYFMDQDWQSAHDYLKNAISITPDDPDILYALVVSDEELGQFDEAKKLLTYTLSISPEHIDSLNAMGDLLARQYQQYDAAETYLNRVLALDPNNTPALHTLGLIYYKKADYNTAIQFLQKAYTLNKAPDIAADLGEVLWVNGQPQQAMLVWKSALKDSPHDPQLQKTMHRFLP